MSLVTYGSCVCEYVIMQEIDIELGRLFGLLAPRLEEVRVCPFTISVLCLCVKVVYPNTMCVKRIG